MCSGAQRLSASLEFTRACAAYSTHGSYCAQRLSASLEFTHTAQGVFVKLDNVLNAFRHHWNSHAAAGQVHHPGCVLNAFRHHWNSHKLTRRVLKEMAKVLNAFRHHWNSHRVEAQVKELP